MPRVEIYVGGRERLEPAITKATPLGALGPRPWSGSAPLASAAAPPPLRALADALVEAADLADDYDVDPDAFNERERADRDLADD